MPLFSFFGSYFLMGIDTSLLGSGQTCGNWTSGTLVFTVMAIITIMVKMTGNPFLDLNQPSCYLISIILYFVGFFFSIFI